MSEAKQESPAPKSKKRLLMIIIAAVVVVVLLVVGVLAFVLLKGNAAPAEEGAPAAEHAAPKKKDEHKKEAPPVFEKLGQFTVNLNSAESDEKMQVELMVELATEHDKEKLKQYQPKLQNAVLQLLRSKTPQDVKSPDSQEKIGKEIREIVNKILGVNGEDEGVRSVNFTSFIVA